MQRPSIDPWRQRTIALSWQAALSALMTLAARAALPAGGHNYLLGIASLLGTILGGVAFAVFMLLLGIHAARWLLAGRRKRPF